MSLDSQDRLHELALLVRPSQPLGDEVARIAAGCGFAVRRLERPEEGHAASKGSGFVLICGDAADIKFVEAWINGLSNRPACFGIFGREAADCLGPVESACCDFLFWPAASAEVQLRLRRFIRNLRPPLPTVKPSLAEEFASLNLVGRSPSFLGTLDRIKRIAPSDATVLIEGPTGVGKELAARAIHYLGSRSNKPFVPVNCGALPDTLVENELFGHESGAFTDARRSQRGVIDQARGGTLFLDEVEALSPKGQVILLRFLEDQQFRPLGGEAARSGDVRVIAAGNRSLAEMVASGEFRSDLLYRLNVLNLRIAPLCERPEDIEPLCKRLLAKLRSRYGGPEKTISPATLAWLERRPWPGNVRELENVLHRAYVMSDSDVIVVDDGPTAEEAGHSFQEAKQEVLERFEREYLSSLMAQSGGNVTRAAKMAGKERRALGKLLKKHGYRRAS